MNFIYFLPCEALRKLQVKMNVYETSKCSLEFSARPMCFYVCEGLI